MIFSSFIYTNAKVNQTILGSGWNGILISSAWMNTVSNKTLKENWDNLLANSPKDTVDAKALMVWRHPDQLLGFFFRQDIKTMYHKK